MSERYAFSVLMSAQRELSKKSLPDLISEPRNAKQRLRNDVIEFFREKKCEWAASEIPTLGANLIQAITNALWVVDGFLSVREYSFQFLPRCSSSEPLLNELCKKLEQCSDYECVSVEDFSPLGSSAKYSYMKCVKNHGFAFPVVLVTYAHGNNVGNMNFVWKVPSCDESAFSDSQSVILKLQEKIPVFHTRAMRKQMFQRLGRLMPSVKPAILRNVYKSLTGMLLLLFHTSTCHC